MWRLACGLAVLLTAAAAIKLTALVQLARHPLLQPLGGLDAEAYVTLARDMVGGATAGAAPFHLSPLYVYFLAGVFAVTDGSLVAARALQAALGLVTIALVVLTTRRWFGHRAGWIAGALATATGLLTFHEVLILQAAVDPLLTALALWLVTRLAQDGPRWAPAAGLALGLLSLNRPNALAYAVAVVLMAAWRGLSVRSGTRQGPAAFACALAPAAWLVVGLSVAIAPVTLRNYLVSGDFVLISSHGGLNFYIGNNANADGTYTAVPGITPSIAGQVGDTTRVAEQALGHTLKPSEVSAYFSLLAWQWMGQHPRAAASLLLRKLALTFNAQDLSLNGSYAFYSLDEATVLRWLPIGPRLLLPLGLVGLLLPLVAGRRAGYLVWASFVPVYGLSVAAFFVSTRYRLPLLVPLICASGGALAWFYDQARARRLGPAGVLLAALGIAAVPTNWNFHLDDGRSAERTDMILYYVDSGQDARAAELLARTEAVHPQRDLLLYRVGRAYLERGDAAAAVPLLERAAQANGGRVEIRTTLGRALAGTGRAALDGGDAAKAEPLLARAAAMTPTDAGVFEALGLARGLQGRSTEAIAAIETACRLDETSASARLNLAVLLAEVGRLADARRLALDALRLRPDYPQARNLLAAIDRSR